MSEECSKAKQEAVRQILDEWEDRRDRESLREATNYDVILSSVRHSGVQWDRPATVVAGALHNFLIENYPDRVAPLQRFQRV